MTTETYKVTIDTGEWHCVLDVECKITPSYTPTDRGAIRGHEVEDIFPAGKGAGCVHALGYGLKTKYLEVLVNEGDPVAVKEFREWLHGLISEDLESVSQQILDAYAGEAQPC